MGKKNTKETQKITLIMDASNISTPYDTATAMSNTEEVKRIKQVKNVALNVCKCKNKKTANIYKPTRTWESISNLYGDPDTTEVWDNQDHKRKILFSSKLHKKEKPKATIDESENDVIIYPTTDLKNTPEKLFHNGLHRNGKKKRNKIKIGEYVNENSKDVVDIKFSPYNDSKLIFKLNKKPKKGLTDNYALEDICTEGPCRDALENLYNLYGLKYTPYKDNKITKFGNNGKSKKRKQKNKANTKETKIIKKSKDKQAKVIKTKKDGNIGDGDQILSILKKPDLKDVQCKCSFIGKMMRYTNCKCKYNTGITLQTPRTVNDDKTKKENTFSKEYKIIKKSKNKHAKKNNITKDRNVGYGDQISPIPLKKQDLKDIQCKCSFIEKMMRHKVCKYKNNTGSTLQTSSDVNNRTRDPLLEMKVNLKDMHVINSPEVNEKIRKLGKVEKKMSCICPSRKKSLIGGVCKKGICERALENKNSHFNCKCQKRDNILVECNDSTCDLRIEDIKIKSKQKKQPKSPVYKYKEDNKPLFEVMLDATDMNVINDDEIKDIIKKANKSKIVCPTGICNKMSKQGNVHLNCKCVGKILTSNVNECEESTCRNVEENWTGQEENKRKQKRWPVRVNRYDTNIKRPPIVRSHRHYKQNKVMINLGNGQTLKKGTYVGGKLSDVWSKYFCECNKKQPKKHILLSRRRRRGFFRKKKKDHTCKDKILDCLNREQGECDKKVIKKSKEYKKNERKAIIENKKIAAKQKQIYKARQQHWNCLTNFISGFLNVAFESVKKAFKVVFSLIVDPIGCYVYVREKKKKPRAAITRIFEWFVRTWKNKSSDISKTLQESTTLNVIADEIESSAVYNALAPKGKTPAERMMYERRSRTRKRRMHKRNNEAIHDCRHILLTTLRKTPCLCFYHICPHFYPQCLSLLAFMKNFLHVLLYCAAVMCWTPCILACEMCRACICCFLCTH